MDILSLDLFIYSLACSLALLEIQLLSLASPLFTGWMCLFSSPGRESKPRNSLAAASTVSAKEPLLCQEGTRPQPGGGVESTALKGPSVGNQGNS